MSEVQTAPPTSGEGTLSRVNLDTRLQTLSETSGLSPEIIEQLAKFIGSADDRELYRMSPYRYARAMGITDQQGIDLFVHATHAGIFDFNWGVLCPGCGAFITTSGGLKSLHSDKPCSLCRVEIHGQMDDNVEVAFTVSPAVRRIRFHNTDRFDFLEDGMTLFFSSSVAMDPQMMETIKAAMFRVESAPPASTHTFKQTFEPGYYAVMAPAHHSVGHIKVGPEYTAHEIDFEIFDGSIMPLVAYAAPGELTLRVRNRADHALMLALMHDPTGDPDVPPAEHPPFYTLMPFLTAKQLVTNQAFRDLFRTESLPTGGGLELRSLTLLFTDLKGSTELYERIGDFRAFELVREHFDMMRDIIAHHGGAVVKTIGDAGMASFAEPLAALEASAALKRDIRKLGNADDHDLMLKIGLHSGPCIAVESNERLDYFGQTVNIAARAQGVASANEVVCTDAIWTSPGAEALIKGAFAEVLKDRAFLKGVDNPFKIYRLR